LKTQKFKKHVFFYTCPNSYLGGEIPLEKKRFSSWKSNIFETVRDRKKIVNQKFIGLMSIL